MTRETKPVEKMDMDEQELHKYLQEMTRPREDFVFVPPAEEEEEDN